MEKIYNTFNHICFKKTQSEFDSKQFMDQTLKFLY